jgi:hypothetical protein
VLLEERGLVLFLEVLVAFQDKLGVERRVLGVIKNIA